MTSVPTGVRPPTPCICMISGDGHRQREGGGQAREGDSGEEDEEDAMMDAVLESLIDEDEQQEAEDDVAELFGDFAEESVEQEQESQGSPPTPGRRQQEAPEPPSIPLPVCPSQEEWDEHFRTHINYRCWCPICIEARGREDPHRKLGSELRPGCPVVYFDYEELRKGCLPLLVVKDQTTKAVSIHRATCKGWGDRCLVQKFCMIWRIWGTSRSR